MARATGQSGWLALFVFLPYLGALVLSIWAAFQVPPRHSRSRWWALALLVPGPNLVGYWAYAFTLPRLTVRGSELNQVWTNLLDNAIDALGEEGTITVRTHRDGDCAVVDIADTGPGIPPEQAPRIFEPFFTTKAVGRGTGLGLDTARRIVEERHRGSLTFDTGPGGTTFHVWLPLDGG